MPLKAFTIEGEGTEVETGLRSGVRSCASEYGLQVSVTDLVNRRGVEVIVEGPKKVIRDFWNYVRTNEVRHYPSEGNYEVSPLRESSNRPEWDSPCSSSMGGAAYLGFLHLGRKLKKLKI